jgi:hypothetical protein
MATSEAVDSLAFNNLISYGYSSDALENQMQPKH